MLTYWSRAAAEKMNRSRWGSRQLFWVVESTTGGDCLNEKVE